VFDHPWVRRLGPFSRIGSIVNVVIIVAINVVGILDARSDFERQGFTVWAAIMAVVFIAIAIVVWVRWFRGRPPAGDPTSGQ
jgi:hypothetical protein